MPVQMIKPERIRITDVRAAIDAALEAGIAIVAEDMRESTATWDANTKPRWQKVGPRTLKGGRAVDYKTSDTPFFWVNEGTKGPYPIPKSGPHPKGLGPFQPDFVPKTFPRQLGSGPGGRFGEFISPKRVIHPGIKARDFTGVSALRLDYRLFRIMQLQLNGVESL